MKQFRLLLDGTWCNDRRGVLTGTTPRRYQTCRRPTQRATNATRKEGTKSYADMTVYTIEPATNFLPRL